MIRTRNSNGRTPASWLAGLALLLLTLTPMVFATPASAGPAAFVGVYTNESDFLIGAGWTFAVGPITAFPNAEYVFVDFGNYYTLNADGHLNVFPLGVASLWAGAGVGIHVYDPEIGDGDSQTGVNLLAGANFNLTRFKPFVQFKYVAIDGEDPIALTAGIHF